MSGESEKTENTALTSRLISGFILAPLAVAFILLGGVYFTGWVGIASVIALYEWMGMVKNSQHQYHDMVTGGLYLMVCFGSYVFLRFGFEQGAWLALGVLLAVAASDTGAFFVGKMVGGAKLAPKISPKKTWAGFFGAMFFCGLLLMVLVGLGHAIPPDLLKTDIGLKPKHVWIVFFIGGILGAVGQAGDLLISWFKRRAGLKDTGHLIPGHGGLLDRIDSLLLVSPVFLVIMMLWFK